MYATPSKRLSTTWLSFSILCCLIGVCSAQPPNRKPRENDEFFNVLGQSFKEASNNLWHLWRLLEHPSIQAEIGLDEAEFKAIEELNIKHFNEIRAIREKYKNGIDKVMLLKELVETIDKQDVAFMDKLAETCNLNRLLQLDVQYCGTRAVTHTEIAKRIGLSSDKLTELRGYCDSIRREEWEQMAGKIEEMLRSPQGNKKVRELYCEIDNRVNKLMKAKLTAQELESLNNLKGEAFVFPEDLFESRRRGGMGGRNDGRGGNDRGTSGSSEKDRNPKNSSDPNKTDPPKC